MTEFDAKRAEERRLERVGKVCRRCQQTKPPADFPTAKARGKIYVRAWCRACLRVYFNKVIPERRRQQKRLGAATG